jgi:CRISPR-associated protein Csb2
MPIGILNSSGTEKTSLVFDAWANTNNESLIVYWDCDLTEAEFATFKQLAESLAYLGRSESWVEVSVIESYEVGPNTIPFDGSQVLESGQEQVHVLVPMSPEMYAEWYDRKKNEISDRDPLPGGKVKSTSKAFKDALAAREKALDAYPADLIDCLTKDTAWWKERRWAQPPGSQFSLYSRPANGMNVSPSARPMLPIIPLVDSMLISISTRSGNRSALPPICRTLPLAEILHRQLVGTFFRKFRKNCPALTGCDEQGNPLRNSHQHTHILPLDLDQDEHLDHVLIHAPMGLDSEAQLAIRSIRKTYAKESSELQLAVAGVGTAEELLASSSPSIVSKKSLAWKSLTPFVLPRFQKKTGKNSLIGQIQAELESRGLPLAASVEILREETLAFRHFIRIRRNGTSPPVPPADCGFALRISFHEPLSVSKLPLCLGYASHFGLGAFNADD